MPKQPKQLILIFADRVKRCCLLFCSVNDEVKLYNVDINVVKKHFRSSLTLLLGNDKIFMVGLILRARLAAYP
jgi:hypothetical protein